jgi:hypothetical protein
LRRERDSTHERELVNLHNPEDVKRQREKLEYISAISSREWLGEAEGMDQAIQLYPELKSLSCQVGNLSYQDGIRGLSRQTPLFLSEASPINFGSNHRDRGNP